MMEWYTILSYALTNALRIYMGLVLVVGLLRLAKPARAIATCSLLGSVLITTLSVFLQLSPIYMLGAEAIFLVIAARYLFHEQTRMSLFLIIFYEMGVAQWEFLCSAWVGVAFHSSMFMEANSMEHLAVVWLVRILMIAIAMFLCKKDTQGEKGQPRLASLIVVLGFLGIISLSAQTVIAIEDDALTTWLIYSAILLMSVMFFNMNRQYEMEKEVARLKAEQAQQVERDYRSLNKAYSANARLYHDLHHHIDALHGLLTQGKTSEAATYLEELRGPVQEITQSTWTGDEAVDYLISSKIASAQQDKIETQVNIEFPRNTNIRGVDLSVILGNLLDNALENSKDAQGDFRFLNLTIRRINSMLVIKVDNGYSQEPVSTTNGLRSSKSDGGLHGWGVKSVRAAAEKYDGVIETTYADHIFRAVVTLSYTAIR